VNKSYNSFVNSSINISTRITGNILLIIAKIEPSLPLNLNRLNKIYFVAFVGSSIIGYPTLKCG